MKQITDKKQLAQWFPDVVSLEPRIGGKITFKFSGDSSTIPDIVEGKIIEIEKNKKLSYTWSHPTVPGFPITTVTWNIEQLETNKTKVVIVHSGFVDEKIMNSYNKRWMWITEHLDSFAVAESPVDLRKQMKSLFIPGADSKAFYRIKKARKASLYITTPVMVATVAFLMMMFSNLSDLQNNVIDKTQFNETLTLAIIIFMPIFISITLFAAYLMNRWTKEWNRQFVTSSQNE